jgi:predicted amidophosphoribosyltransferase
LTLIAGVLVFILALEGTIADKGIIVGFIIFVIGMIFLGTGNYMRQKARHVAWTQEAIERERYASGKEMKCPQCGIWNSKESNYCSECSLPLKTKCLKCGEYNSRGGKFCSKCGSPFEAVER